MGGVEEAQLLDKRARVLGSQLLRLLDKFARAAEIGRLTLRQEKAARNPGPQDPAFDESRAAPDDVLDPRQLDLKIEPLVPSVDPLLDLPIGGVVLGPDIEAAQP